MLTFCLEVAAIWEILRKELIYKLYGRFSNEISKECVDVICWFFIPVHCYWYMWSVICQSAFHSVRYPY